MGYGSACQDERNLVTASVAIVEMLLVSAYVVGHEDDERVFPFGQLAVSAHDGTHHTVGIGKSIQSLVFQSAVGHFERLMTARCLEDSEHRTACWFLVFDVVHQPVGHDMVVHSPFAQSLFDREVLV